MKTRHIRIGGFHIFARYENTFTAKKKTQLTEAIFNNSKFRDWHKKVFINKKHMAEHGEAIKKSILGHVKHGYQVKNFRVNGSNDIKNTYIEQVYIDLDQCHTHINPIQFEIIKA